MSKKSPRITGNLITGVLILFGATFMISLASGWKPAIALLQVLDDNEPSSSQLFTLVFVVLAGFFSWRIPKVMAAETNWTSAHQVYARSRHADPGMMETAKRVSGWVGSISGNVWQLGTNSKGLFLSIAWQMFMMRPFLPRLFIPWEDVVIELPTQLEGPASFVRRMVGQDFVTIKTTRVPEFVIRVRGVDFKRFLRSARPYMPDHILTQIDSAP